MKKIVKYISPFRLLALAVLLFGIWLLTEGSGGPHGYGILFGNILLFLAIVIFTLDALINAACKNSKSISYLIQLVAFAIFLGWIYLTNS